MSQAEIHSILENLFRSESGRVVGYLTRFLGSSHLDLAENALQESFARAANTWPSHGIPKNPSAWIFQVSKNYAIDCIRSGKFLSFDSDLTDRVQASNETSDSDFELGSHFDSEIQDDQLKLMFICCHPKLSRDAQLALTLKIVCGFTIHEISRAFLSREDTIAQRIVRAKRAIAEYKIKFEVPEPNILNQRLRSVLEVLYLLFNEGYSVSKDGSFLSRDICQEAIYRVQILSEHPVCQSPEIYALLALMHFQISRFGARLSLDGEIILLEDQDRSRWDTKHIAKGLNFLNLSVSGEELSSYHLQAGISACHAVSSSAADTDWERILGYYDALLFIDSSPIIKLNRAVAFSMVHGFTSGLPQLELLKSDLSLSSYYLLPATVAEMNFRIGNFSAAKHSYEQALKLVALEVERRFILKRIKDCETGNAKLANNGQN